MRQMMTRSGNRCKRALVCILNSFLPSVRAKNAITASCMIVTAAEELLF